MPISAILFGGRRATVVPAGDRGLRLGARRVPRLDHGLGDHRGGGRGDRQPAPRPLRHAAVLRLQHGRLLGPLARGSGPREGAQLPKIFYVNWFRKDADGRFLWPGFGENSRVLAWIFDRVDGTGDAVDTPIGRLPDRRRARPVSGLDLSADDVAELLQGRRRGLAQGAARPSRTSTASSATACPRRCEPSSTTWSAASPNPDRVHRPHRSWPCSAATGGPIRQALGTGRHLTWPRPREPPVPVGAASRTGWPASPRACGRWPSPSPCSSRRATPAGPRWPRASRLLPYVLLSPLAGALADRWGHRRTLEVTSVVRIGLAALLTAGIAMRRAAGGAGPAAFAATTAATPVYPTLNAFVPDRRGRPTTWPPPTACCPRWRPSAGSWVRPSAGCCSPSASTHRDRRGRHRPARRRPRRAAARAPARHDRCRRRRPRPAQGTSRASVVERRPGAALQSGAAIAVVLVLLSTNLIDGSSQVLLLLVSDRKLGLGDGGLRPAQRRARDRCAGRRAW